MKKFLVATALVGTIVAPALTVSAYSQEVSDILYEKTDNPKLWLKFIEDMKYDSTGMWLEELILKLSDGQNSTEIVDGYEKTEEAISIIYKSVIEGFDYGPATSKVVIKPSATLDMTTIDKDTFDVVTVSTYKDMDYSTFTLAEEATEHEGIREVTSAYPSDEKGNYDEKGEYIALELVVGPDLTASSPFSYNFLTGRNSYIPYYFKISQADGANILSSNGNPAYIIPAGAKENLGDYKLIADDFENNQKFSNGDIELLYASYVPETASKEEGSNPLVIWLHGAGEGGTDTTIALLGNKVVNLATDEIQQYFGDTGAYILAPQSPTMWMDADGNGTYNNSVEGNMGESYYTETLMGLIDNYVKTNPEIDKSRIYIGGCSNGGYMTVNMILNYPEYFAAAYPICEAYSDSWLTDEKVDAIKDLPIWLTHALTDSIVPVANGDVEGLNLRPYTKEDGSIDLTDDFSNGLYNRLVEKEASNVYYSLFADVVDTSGKFTNEDGTPYEYMGHLSWIYALNNECVKTIDGVETTLFDWLSQQSK